MDDFGLEIFLKGNSEGRVTAMRLFLLLLCIGLATAISLDESIIKLNELETSLRNGLIINVRK